MVAHPGALFATLPFGVPTPHLCRLAASNSKLHQLLSAKRELPGGLQSSPGWLEATSDVSEFQLSAPAEQTTPELGTQNKKHFIRLMHCVGWEFGLGTVSRALSCFTMSEVSAGRLTYLAVTRRTGDGDS